MRRVACLVASVSLLLAFTLTEVIAVERAWAPTAAPLASVDPSDVTDWHLVMPAASPPVRFERAIAYDSARGRLVSFGSTVHYPPHHRVAETWEWDGSKWTQRTPPTSPSGRFGHAMVYDSARGRVVLFGGFGESGLLDDTWEWDGSTWTQLAPATRPPARGGHAMAYDSSRERVVLFAGLGGEVICAGTSGVLADPPSPFLADTWEWDGSTWVQRAPLTSPSARAGHAMAYDSARRRVVLFGGGVCIVRPAETWEWDGGTWIQRTPSSTPPARDGHAMAYDVARDRIVLFGGVGANGNSLADTWEWSGSAWAQQIPATSPPDQWFGMAYDSTRRRVVIFGGSRSNIWEWDGVTWVEKTPATSPPARYVHAMAYDGTRGRVVLFGGSSGYDDFADTWEWDGSVWVQQTPATGPPAHWGHAMVYDGARGRVVMFGGIGESGFPVADTWEWDGSTWVQKTPTTSPSTRGGHAMTYDSARGRVVLFGGFGDYYHRQLADTWEWDGSTWIQQTPSASPPARSGHAMAYDGARGRVVMFGGYGASGRLADTWEWDGSTWVERTSATSPSARDGHAMAYDGARGRVVMFGGWVASGYGGFGILKEDTWEWDGSTWVQQTPVTHPPARDSHAMAYDSERGIMVMFGGSDASGPLADTWEYSIVPTFYRDADGDGYGDASLATHAWSAPEGYVENDDDCDDGDPAVNPGAIEICNRIDDDCDGLLDEDGDGVDADGDGVHGACDRCPSTPPGEIVNAAGCSISQLVPSSGPWRSHGEYVSAVAAAAGEFVAQRLITEAQKGAIVSAAARSDVGKRR